MFNFNTTQDILIKNKIITNKLFNGDTRLSKMLKEWKNNHPEIPRKTIRGVRPRVFNLQELIDMLLIHDSKKARVIITKAEKKLNLLQYGTTL